MRPCRRATANLIAPRRPIDAGSLEQTKVCVIGSGNWGSAIAKIIGGNTKTLPFCHDQVNMWVYEETVTLEDGSTSNLTDVINARHENVKYLPGIALPENVVAIPDLEEACRDATLLVFVLPHQFLPRLLPTIREASHPSCRGVSLIKGIGEQHLVTGFKLFYGRHLTNISRFYQISAKRQVSRF